LNRSCLQNLTGFLVIKPALREEEKNTSRMQRKTQPILFCQMNALEWLMEWQEKQRNKKSSYFIPHNNELRGAKPLVGALKQRNLWPWAG